MEKLREMVMKMATADQNKSLWPSQIAQIDQHLQIAFPSGLHTPNHPPYAAMIYKAITELNEGGSSEESISEYIKAEYKDLPFAHTSFLSQHLRKLCEKGFVVFTAGKLYTIRNLTAVPVGKGTRSINRKNYMNHVTPPSEEYIMSVDNCSVNDESKENNGRKRNKPRRKLVFDEEDEHDELCNAVITKLSLTSEVTSLANKGKGRTKSRRVTTEAAKKKPMVSESRGSKGESSKGLVKRKKKDMMKWMITAFSDLQDEENPKEVDMGNQIIEYNARKDPSCLLQSLVHTRFFEECKVHSDVDSNKCNSYCVDCMNGALCNFCRFSHKDHNLIRISQSMWENVVAASQIQMYIDLSEIQSHLIKPRTYVSLKRTVGSRRRKHFTGACFICKRYLPESFKFCSLYCKFENDLASDAPFSTN